MKTRRRELVGVHLLDHAGIELPPIENDELGAEFSHWPRPALVRVLERSLETWR